MIQLNSVSKHFGPKRIFENITTRFEPGKVYGIIGENGAGKTTLFRCIAGLEYHEGSIIADKKPLKNHLGYLLTEPYFFPKITGLEYLKLMTTARNQNIGKIDEKNIFDLPLSEYVSIYSTGMKKKLSLLAILLQGNDYFILDEPFNGVDLQSNLIILEIIQQLKQLNKIVIISSHILSTLKDSCDVVHFLDHGTFTHSFEAKDFDQLYKILNYEINSKKIELLNLQ